MAEKRINKIIAEIKKEKLVDAGYVHHDLLEETTGGRMGSLHEGPKSKALSNDQTVLAMTSRNLGNFLLDRVWYCRSGRRERGLRVH